MQTVEPSLDLPDLVICGVPKAATSSLFDWISAHPDALGTREKETYFFVDPGTHMFRADRHVSLGLEAYGALFPPQHPSRSPPLVRLEATPSYIYSETALAQIPDLPNAPKCLFVLREPASQVLSLFSYFKGNWDWIPADLSFADYVAALEAGTGRYKGNELAENALRYAEYVDYLEAWRNRLGPDRMKLVLFDDIQSKPRATVQEIAQWIGLAPDFYENFDFKSENATYSPRSRLLHRANITLRTHLPKGRVYNWARSLYRRLNTTRGRGRDATERNTLAALRKRYAEPNRRLAERFHLDLSIWEACSEDD